MSAINFGKTVSLAQAAGLIVHVPQNNFFLQGPPGIGKSSILEMLAKMLPDYHCAYVDVGTKDLGDTAMPVVDHDAKVTRYYPNEVFGITKDRPVIIMLDEFTKGMRPVQNMLHPLLENKPRLGSDFLKEGSRVFLTGNAISDGVGDSLAAHSRNRITVLDIAPPDASEWLQWAIAKGTIDPILLAFVDRFPHIMATYTDENQADNPYIFNPKKQQRSFSTPRSLEKASNVIAARSKLDDTQLIAALSGTIGEAAARDIQAFIAYQDQLPSWDVIMDNPKGAPVPTSAGACAVLVFGAVMRIDSNNIDTFMSYLDRMDAEWQAAFCINLARDAGRQGVAFSNKTFAKWVRENEDIL